LINDITPGIIDNWLLSLKVSSQTTEHIRITLRIIFREALRERYIQSNPMDFIERGKISHKSNQPPTMDELKRLFPTDRNQFKKICPLLHYGIMCATTATTGLRMQEVRAMTPKSLMMDKSGIIVAQAVKTTGEIGLPKADEIRVVLVPQETMNLLSWWMDLMRITDPDQLLFTGREGGPIDRKAPYKYYRLALQIN
jgi:integrase